MQLHQFSSDLAIPSLTANTENASKLYLDIETTGFTSDVSAIFMIGCGYIKEQRLHCIQWLADGVTAAHEQEILCAFSSWVDASFPSKENIDIITYNGQTFDLPFLKDRYSACHYEVPKFITHANHIDLYRQMSKLKHFLPVKNLKLKTLGTWLGYSHHEAPFGKQLIKTYQNYIKTKDSDLLNLLFLHNIDDLESLFFVQSISAYVDVFHGGYQIHSVTLHSKDLLTFELTPVKPLPNVFSYQALDYTLDFHVDKIAVTAKGYPRGFRYYYADVKNYVYLPEEDYVLHKSMAKYIDKTHYIKASEENCYTWFIPEPSFLENPEKIHNYLQMIFQSLRLL